MRTRLIECEPPTDLAAILSFRSQFVRRRRSWKHLRVVQIAVLPLTNMSRDPADEYFSDSLAEEIINALTQLAGLKVIARTSRSRSRAKTIRVKMTRTPTIGPDH